MKENQETEQASIASMHPGDYFILDPRWKGQQTICIARTSKGGRWILVSKLPFKTQLKEFAYMLLLAVGLILMGSYGFQKAMISKSFYAGLIILAGTGLIVIFWANRKKVVLHFNSAGLELEKYNAFQVTKARWTPDEIEGFRFIDSGDSKPAACPHVVYNLELIQRKRQPIILLQFFEQIDLVWIAAGLSAVLGLQPEEFIQKKDETQGRTAVFTTPSLLDFTSIKEKLASMPQPAGLDVQVKEFEIEWEEDDDEEKDHDEEEGEEEAVGEIKVKNYLQVLLQGKRSWKLALHRPIAILLFVLALGICMGGVFAAAAISFPNDFLVTLFIVGIVLVALLPIVSGAILWSSKSAIVHQKVILRTDGDQHLVLICKGWTEINPSQVRRVGLMRTDTWSFFSGTGIPGRPFIKFGKAWAIELTTRENMTTTIELPFDRPECEWISRLLEKVFQRPSSAQEH